MPERHEQIHEGFGRDVELADRLRQRDENWMNCPAAIAVVELRLPPGQQGQTLFEVAGFVGQVVGPATIGVEVANMLPQPAGQEPAGDGEVLVVPSGQPPAITPALAQRKNLRSGRPRAVTTEIVGKHASSLETKHRQYAIRPGSRQARLAHHSRQARMQKMDNRMNEDALSEPEIVRAEVVEVSPGRRGSGPRFPSRGRSITGVCGCLCYCS